MKNYVYVVMENSQEFDWGELMGGTIRPVAAFSSREEAEAVALLKRKSAERNHERFEFGNAPYYYVERLVSYS